MGSSYYSDYGSGSTSETFSLWGSQETWLPLQNRMQEAGKMKEKSASFSDVTAKRSIDDVLQEFRMNGSDSPYDPDEDAMNKRTGLMGLGPASVYLRQKSWPAPERSPVINLPQPLPSPAPCNDTMSSTSSSTLNVEQTEMLTPEQLRVLKREKSAAMMRSIRTASGRRRAKKLAPSNNATEYYVRFGEKPPSVIRDVNVYNKYEHPPLDPNWAALEKRLMFEKFF
ncbi:unnamed protein product [Parnassius apollo]|uniref:(apollo) hypothetical protein n=1 Tax=Parnassius apollo TaxID=110799 RepID=A0A8S3WR75_PARAO|nr:unnamed protein product [Parnassius apollo]